MTEVQSEPALHSSPALGSWQWLATEFTLYQSVVINQVDGWMFENDSYQSASNAPVNVLIYSDGGEVPGSILYSATFTPGDSLGWYGADGLNWSLEAGTYWVAFEVDRSWPSPYAYEYTMPFVRDNNLNGAGWNYGHPTLDYSANDLITLGVRIFGNLTYTDSAGLIYNTPNPTMTEVQSEPALHSSPALGSWQWLATEFTLYQSVVINQVDGWMFENDSYQSASNAPVNVVIYSDGGEVPGSILYSATFTPGDSLDWYGADSLNWSLEAGTYWVAFEVDRSLQSPYAYEYVMPLVRDNNLNGAGWNYGHSTLDYSANDLNTLGVRIFGNFTYTVTPSAGPNGSIFPDNPYYVSEGGTTSISIIPDSGYKIASISGCGGSLVGDTFTTSAITEDCTVTATFTPIQITHTLDVTIVGEGSVYIDSGDGTLCTDNCLQDYVEGTTVPLYVNYSGNGYSFAGWTGDCNGSVGDCFVTMDTAKNVTATFLEIVPNPVILEGSPGSFTTIQFVYDGITSGQIATIKVKAGLQASENLMFDRDVTFRLEGGYDQIFTNIVGDTSFNGTLTISDGQATISDLIIK